MLLNVKKNLLKLKIILAITMSAIDEIMEML